MALLLCCVSAALFSILFLANRTSVSVQPEEHHSKLSSFCEQDHPGNARFRVRASSAPAPRCPELTSQAACLEQHCSWRPSGRCGSNVAIVTGYWDVKNKYGDKMKGYLTTGLTFENDAFVFADDQSPVWGSIREIRSGVRSPTNYTGMTVENFHSRALFREHARKGVEWTHDVHVPSLELGLIWLEKYHLARLVAETAPHDWIAWIDAGLSIYRTVAPSSIAFEQGDVPWPDRVLLETLPKDRMSISISDGCVGYSEISWEYTHMIAGGVWIVHRDLAGPFAELFYKSMLECMEREDAGFHCLSDQVILTRMYWRTPELFNILPPNCRSDCYGLLVPYLHGVIV